MGEKARDEESRCSLYPPATSLILTMKDRNTEEKPQKKEEAHNQTTFLLTTFLPLPVHRVPCSLTVPLLCDGLQSNRYVRGNEGGGQ